MTPERHRATGGAGSFAHWRCHRCQSRGQLWEYWQSRPLDRASRRAIAHRIFALPSASIPSPEPLLPPAAKASPDKPTDFDWHNTYAQTLTIVNSPGGHYLVGRGIPPEIADAAGAGYCASWYGRAAVLFPVCEQTGDLVAVHGRYIDGVGPKARSGGKLKLGVFATPGALDADPLVITEAPVDALSLAACGVPALSLCGTAWPIWLPEVAAFRRVAIGLDADEAGDTKSTILATHLRAFGAVVDRWRPSIRKDWNDVLMANPTGLRASLTAVVAASRTCDDLAEPEGVSETASLRKPIKVSADFADEAQGSPEQDALLSWPPVDAADLMRWWKARGCPEIPLVPGVSIGNLEKWLSSDSRRERPLQHLAAIRDFLAGA